MRYQGGKFYEGKWIAGEIAKLRRGRPYWEPFCGACGVMRHVRDGRRLATDLRSDIVLMWRAACDGWTPPEVVDLELYQSVRDAEPSPLRGFIGAGCSYAGKWFGGLARSSKDGEASFAGQRRRMIERAGEMQGVEFRHADYSEGNPGGWIVYCDPPYEGGTGYKGLPPFDHVKFWQWVRDWSPVATILTSSFTAPDDFDVLSEMETNTTTRKHGQGGEGQAQKVVERLFIHRGGLR